MQCKGHMYLERVSREVHNILSLITGDARAPCATPLPTGLYSTRYRISDFVRLQPYCYHPVYEKKIQNDLQKIWNYFLESKFPNRILRITSTVNPQLSTFGSTINHTFQISICCDKKFPENHSRFYLRVILGIFS